MPTRSQIDPIFGRGVYTLAEVSRLVERPHQTVRSWFSGRDLLRPDYDKLHGSCGASFHDLIDVLVASHLRSLGVRMSIVRKAYRRLTFGLATRHPFCHHGIYTDGRSIIVDAAHQIGEPKLEDVLTGQGWFDQLRDTLANVSYSAEHNLAKRWRIAEGVMIDPAIALGTPVIEGTRVATHVAARAFHANAEDAEFVAHLYGLRVGQIRNAVRFEHSLTATAA